MKIYLVDSLATRLLAAEGICISIDFPGFLFVELNDFSAFGCYRIVEPRDWKRFPLEIINLSSF
jgi:hypothetical protein